MENKFIDFHCHSAMKPYSKSFSIKANRGKNTLKHVKRSIWYKSRLTLKKKILQALTTLTKFTQADFTSAHKGGAKVLMVSIDPMERELILSKKGKKQRLSGRLLKNLVTGIGQRRINHLFKLNNYFEDLHLNLNFLEQIQGKHKSIDGKNATYKLVDAYDDIDFQAKNTIHIIPTMEGGHVFRSDIDSSLSDAAIKKQMLDNIDELKSNKDKWSVTPFFVSLAHHFPNKLCGQAKSLTGLAAKAYDQKLNPRQGLEDLGKEVIDALLSTDNGKRIFIDIKHMNLKTRFHYFKYLKSPKYAGQKIPIIVSHGATNNKPIPSQPNTEINFYKEEVVSVAKSGGIFGIQLDARRLRKMKYGSRRRGLTSDIDRRGLYKRAFFVWRQIEVMAILIYRVRKDFPEFQHLDPWGFQVIGSDFDGIVDPLDGYWTHAELPLLRTYLIKQAKAFLRTRIAKALPNDIQLDAQEIVDKFMYKNAQNFLSKHLNR